MAHTFVSRHFDGRCPPEMLLHRALTGLPDAADHEMTFFAGKRARRWARDGTRVLVVSKDDALENTAELLRHHHAVAARFMPPTAINSRADLQRNLPPRPPPQRHHVKEPGVRAKKAKNARRSRKAKRFGQRGDHNKSNSKSCAGQVVDQQQAPATRAMQSLTHQPLVREHTPPRDPGASSAMECPPAMGWVGTPPPAQRAGQGMSTDTKDGCTVGETGAVAQGMQTTEVTLAREVERACDGPPGEWAS